jgi:ribose transport system substrate-binding protein
MKRFLVTFFCVVLVMGLALAGCATTDDAAPADDVMPTDDPAPADDAAPADDTELPEGIKIGVSIWSSTDTLGSEVKNILDAAADALGVEVVYVDQGHISEQVTGSVETLAAAGVDGIIICNSSSAEMTSVINTADQYEVYVAQFFRYINPELNPDEYALAQSSPYYVGAVHEDEVVNGRTLIQMLGDQGSRKIAVMGWEAGDATFLGRLQGYQEGVEAWNEANPDDQIELLETQYGGTSSDTGRATAEAIIAANPDIDGFIAAGGGGDPLIGAIEAIEGLGRTGEIRVVSTDFLPDLDAKLESGAIAGQSGGHYADPLFAFMMVYNAITGNWVVPDDDFYVIHFPYMYVSSPEDYDEYDQFFVDQLPYTGEEFIDMATMSFEELYDTAARLSIEDVKARHR